MKKTPYADEIKAWRLRNNLTTREMADLTEGEISHSTISEIERGNKLPTIRHMIKLSEITQIPPWRSLELMGFRSGIEITTEHIKRALESMSKNDETAAEIIALLPQATKEEMEWMITYLRTGTHKKQ